MSATFPRSIIMLQLESHMMRVGYSTIMYDGSELSTAIGDIGACRYDGIEVNLSEVREKGVQEVKNEIDKYGLDTFCVMGEWLESEEQVDIVAEGATVADELGAPYLALLPPRRGHVNDETFGVWLEQIADAATDAGVTPVLHQHGATHVESPEEIKKWLTEGPDSLGLLLDTAHYYPYGDIVNGVERFADNLEYVHFKDISPPDEFENYVEGLTAGEFNLDNVINYFRSFTDPGEGLIDFGDTLKALEDIDYDGNITIEIENQIADPLIHTKKNHDYYSSLMQ